MGYVIKIGLIFFAIYWIFKGVARFFLGNLIKQAQRQQEQFKQQQNSSYSRPSDGNVNVRNTPQKKGEKSSQNYKGGDYVDYEEVD